MVIGISGKEQSGKNTVCNIIKAISLLDIKSEELTFFISSSDFTDTNEIVPFVEFALKEDYILNLSDWKEHSFADKLKGAASIIFGNLRGEWDNINFKDSTNFLGMTNRQFLQRLGNGVRERISPDIWVKALFQDYHLKDSPKWIIPDVRMENEARAIKGHDGIIIRVNRDTKYTDDDISETSLDDYKFDYVIDNNSSMSDLITNVSSIYNEINIK